MVRTNLVNASHYVVHEKFRNHRLRVGVGMEMAIDTWADVRQACALHGWEALKRQI